MEKVDGGSRLGGGKESDGGSHGGGRKEIRAVFADQGDDDAGTWLAADDEEVTSSVGTAGDDPEPGTTSPAVSLSGPINPLLMVDILQVVFQQILAQPVLSDVAKDVRSIRLVSKTWRDAVTPFYRRKRPPTVICLVDHRPGVIRTLPAMEEFLDTMKDSTMIPVESYLLSCNLLQANHHHHRELLKRFLRICGPEAVSLTFEPTYGADKPDGSREIDNPWRDLSDLKLPKLQHLAFKHTPWLDYSSHRLADFLQLLFNAANHLHQFEITCYCSDDQDQELVSRKVGNAICTGLPPTVKILKLDLIPSFNGQAFLELAKTGVQLAEFKFVDSWLNADKASFCSFLKSQSQTLKSLTIWSYDDEPAPPKYVFWEFPRMEKLVELYAALIIPRPLSFVETFPKLKVLDLSDWDHEEGEFLALLASVEKNKRKSAPSVTKISMPPYLDMPAPALLLKRMSRCFPNVSELSVQSCEFTTKSIPEIFTYFTTVETLEMEFASPEEGNYGDADAVLSGVHRAECDRVRDLPNFDEIKLEKIQQTNSILNLTKLKKLILKKESRYFDVILSDFSVHFLFLRMPALEELCIQDSLVNFSPRYKELLEARLKLTLVGDDDA